MKICPQCKKHFEDTETMCPDCNVQLYKLKLKKKKKKQKMSALKIVLIVLASFFALIVLGIVAFFGVSLYVAHKIVSSPEFSSSAISARENNINLKYEYSKTNQSMVLRYALEGVTAKSYSEPHAFIENVFVKNSFDMVDSFSNSGICDGPTVRDPYRGALLCVNNFASYDDRCDKENQIPCAEDTNAPSLYIDVNGQDGPNILYDGSNESADIYPFILYSTKIEPTKDTAHSVYGKR